MKPTKRKALISKGWKVGDTKDFLGLSDAEAALVEVKLELARSVRTLRRRKRLTQEDLADQFGSSQSRVAKMEAADPSVSVDLLLRALFSLGVTPAGVAKILAKKVA